MENKELTGKIVIAELQTKEGFTRTIILPEFTYQWKIQIYNDLYVIEKDMPEQQICQSTISDKVATFYFDKWIDKEKRKALYIEK